MSKIGEHIKAARGARNLTQDELAARSGVNVSLISRYEAGKLEPSMKTLRRLAAALDVSMGVLVGVA